MSEEEVKSQGEVVQHHLRSINATLAIRQISSQGLSFQLWPAATSLVALLDAHRLSPAASPLAPLLSSLRRPLRILELGSGTGLVSIAAAAALGAAVTATDLPHVLPNLRFNAEANAAAVAAGGGGSVAAKGLRWGEDGDVDGEEEYDLIVGSDVVYHDHLYEPLLRTLRALVLGKGTSFVMAHLKRWKKESAFFRKANKDFHVQVLFRDAPLEGSRVGVIVYCFSDKRENKNNNCDAATSSSDVA